jgi:hypothetical protein
MDSIIGKKYLVVKGGKVDPFRDDRGVTVRRGEIWDLVESQLGGPQLRKLGKRGGSTRLLNGVCYAMCMVDEERARVLTPADPEHAAHAALCAKWDGETEADGKGG